MQMLGHNESDYAPPPRSETAFGIRRAVRADIAAIVKLHAVSLPQFDLADPGPAFLRRFYSFVLRDPEGFLFVSEQSHAVAGFVAGLAHPVQLYQRVASGRFHIFACASACLISHPVQLPKFLADLRRARGFKGQSSDGCETACELITVAVQPRMRMQGHGKALVLALAEAAKCHKMAQVCVHVGSDDGGMAMFYRSLGFKPLRTFKTFDARWLDEYVLTFEDNGMAGRSSRP
ncbi:MAG: GNAT family N-acetyltransferase [Thermoguttaceae bacterium]